MPFSGVLISWLMVARKRDFASTAASAVSRASVSDCSLLRIVSRMVAKLSTSWPISSCRALGSGVS